MNLKYFVIQYHFEFPLDFTSSTTEDGFERNRKQITGFFCHSLIVLKLISLLAGSSSSSVAFISRDLCQAARDAEQAIPAERLLAKRGWDHL